MDDPLFIWRFMVGQHKPSSEWLRSGKAEYSDLVRVRMDRHDAIRIIQSLVAQLDREAGEFEIDLLGQMDEEEE